jgi:hypothetical protein
LTSHENILKGSQTGPVVVAGNANGSELVRRIRGESQPRMPLTGPPFLSDDETRLIAEWIDSGAQDSPADAPVAQSMPQPRKLGPNDKLVYSDVAPIFLQRCIKCHRSDAPNGPPEGLSLKSYDDMIRGGERVVIVPGYPQVSEIVRRIRGIARPRMPFDGPPWLSEEEIARITQWIEQGARDDEGNVARPPVGREVRLYGRLTGQWSVEGLPLIVDGGTRLKKAPRPGGYVEVRGFVGNDGRVHATRIRSR